MTAVLSAPVRPLAAAWLGMAGMAAAMGIGRFAFTPLLPLMQQHAGLTLAQGSWLATANYFGYLVGALACLALPQAPGAFARFGLAAVALLTLAMGLTDSFAAWLIWRFAAGSASAFVLVGMAGWALPIVAAQHRDKASAWIFAGVGIGIVIAGLVGLAVGSAGQPPALGWLALGALAAGVAALAWRPLSVPPRPAAAAAAVPAPARLDRAAWRLVLCYGALGVGYIIPATFLPAVARGLMPDPAVFGWTWPAFGAAAAASTLLVGALFRDVAPRKVWAASQAVMAVGVLAPVLHPSMAALVLSAVCVGSTFLVATMAGMQEARRMAGAAAPRLFAAMTAAFAFGQLVGPLGVGAAAAAQAPSIAVPSIVAAALLLASTLGLLLDRRQRPG